MKLHPLIYLSLGISLCSIGYAAWLHSNTERLAMNALHQRERELVAELAPQFEDIYRDMFPSKPLKSYQPTTIRELIDPLVLLMESVGDTGGTTNEVPAEK